MNGPKGRLFCIPVPLHPEQSVGEVLPGQALTGIAHIQHFVVETPKAARVFLKQMGLASPLQALQVHAIPDADAHPHKLQSLLAPALQGNDIGLLSDAGCPGVADPGARLVDQAHELGIDVVPLIGPSSILMALIASGFNGQQFAFVGYLTAKAEQRGAALVGLETRSARHHETLLWIETPYRAAAMAADCLAYLKDDTRLLVAQQISLPDQKIRQKTVANWRREPPQINKDLVVFALAAYRN
jgi:16S rRNA (cytidine1402-2'-O)-methyltransferase